MAKPAAGRLSTCRCTESIIYPTNTVCTTICRLILAIPLAAEPAGVLGTKPLCPLPRSRCTAKPTTARKWSGSCRSRAWHYQHVHLVVSLHITHPHCRDYSVGSGASFCYTPYHGYLGTCPLHHLNSTDDRPLCHWFHHRPFSNSKVIWRGL